MLWSHLYPPRYSNNKVFDLQSLILWNYLSQERKPDFLSSLIGKLMIEVKDGVSLHKVLLVWQYLYLSRDSNLMRLPTTARTRRRKGRCYILFSLISLLSNTVIDNFFLHFLGPYRFYSKICRSLVWTLFYLNHNLLTHPTKELPHPRCEPYPQH